jgi:phage virion morphogenesis protein
MTARIVIDLQMAEASAAIARLQEFDDDGADLMLRDMGEYLLGSTGARFDAQVAPDGTPWAPLSPRYKKRKDKARPAAKTLVYDNFLKGTLRYLVSRGVLELGSDRPYAAAHQLGATIKRPARSTEVHFEPGEGRRKFAKRGGSNVGKWVTIPAYQIEIPARPFLGTSEADRTELLNIAADHLAAAAQG